MANLKRGNKSDSKRSFRFNLIELIIFSLCLMTVAGLITSKLSSNRQTSSPADPDHQDESTFSRQGAWGELLTQNIKMERPAELIRTEETSPQTQTWVFSGMNIAQIKELFAANGLTTEQAEKALAPNRVISQADNTIFKPGEDFLFSLNSETRQKLYAPMHDMGVNIYLTTPFVFPENSIELIYTDARLHSDDVALLKKLVYPGDGAMKLSDYELLINKIPTDQRRIAMAQALSRLPTSIPSLRIRPDTDLNQIAGYWGRMENVRFSNIRPLLESLKRLPNGGTISLTFLLPPFARERLFTYPSAEAGDPQMDCQWTTFNFSNLQPDNRFNDPKYAAQYLENNFNQIPAPSAYGDLVLLVNPKMEIHHSAVYLAADLVFTKYGNNDAQPWMIVRMSDMQAAYPALKPCYMRKKT